MPRFIRDGTSGQALSSGSGEIGELTHAYTRLTRDLEKSRELLIRAAKLAVGSEMTSFVTSKTG